MSIERDNQTTTVNNKAARRFQQQKMVGVEVY
jgi:hypothetical protein